MAVHEDGAWSLETGHHLRLKYTIVHRCPQNYRRSMYWQQYRYFDFACSNCCESVPEGLQGLFVLLTGDMET